MAMWTNVFRIGEFHTISWFQFLPCESESNTLSENSLKAEQEDVATHFILAAHLKLLSEGFLTTWTNSFVGPWDPSQGVHNPDEKIKLWLFIPGRHTSVSETAKASLLRLKVVGSGIWLAPGDSEEVAIALSQALRNRIERSLRGLSYARFGDVFTRCHSFSPLEKNFRRVQPTFEFIFSATEEAIYVHAIISAKNVRGLSSSDLERASMHCSSNTIREGLPVIVAPNGMRGRFTGCSPSDLVKHVYSSKASNGSTIPSLSNGCQLRGQSCYIEVTIGCPPVCVKALQSNSSSYNDMHQHKLEEHPEFVDERREQKHALHNQFPILERTFIFPAETVLVPILHRAFAKSSFKRLWLHNCLGTVTSDAWPYWNLSGSFLKYCLGVGGAGDIKFSDSLLVESSYMNPLHKHYSRSNSNSSSISSTSSTSSDTDDTMASGACDLEADADSVRQSGLSSSDQIETDGSKMVSKRPRSSVTESYGQAGTPASATSQDIYKSEYNMVEAGNPANVELANSQIESQWDWDDEDRGNGLDIQTLLSEFGDFGDFFKDDLLAFGEPPGMTESQALMFPTADCGDIMGSPFSSRMDMPDQTLLPALSFPPFEDFNQIPPPVNVESFNRSLEITKDTHEVASAGHSAVNLSSKYDYLTKAEALMTFASEYSAVDAPKNEFSSSIFRTPYLPKSKRVESPQSGFSAYVYGATPPPSPHLLLSDDKVDTANTAKSGNEGQDISSSFQSSTYYSHVHGSKNQIDRRSFTKDELTSHKEDIPPVSATNFPGSTITAQRKKTESLVEAGHLLLSPRTVLSTDMECIMFQAAMCRTRHTLLSCNSQVPALTNRLTGRTISDPILGDASVLSNVISSRYEVKKDLIPIRIAGDADGVLDRPLTAPVGVWRSVNAPKAAKPSSSPNIESPSSFSNHTFIAESLPMNGRRQPLQELLDSLALLVQQSSSFVDIALDTSDGEGPYDCLALQEQIRRGFSCGPSMVHAGCGGLLATCHSMDIAGVDLVNPLSAYVRPSSVISLLQSDVKIALRSAFGNLDGPLSVIDWCKGHNLSSDGDMHFVECNANESKDPSSTVTFGGDPISPSTALTGGTSFLKDGTRIDEPSQRRINQESEQQMGSSRLRPTVSVLSLPALLVGYQDDWLKTSANSLKLWEKAPLEPYALPKPMTYYAVCPDIDLLTSATVDFLLQLGSVYEACKLGSHSPHSSNQMDTTSRKWSSSGLVLVDCSQPVKTAVSNASPIGAISDYLVALSKNWDIRSFLDNLTKVLKSLKLGQNSSVNQKEGSSSSCMVIYVVCPFPERTAILDTIIEASVALGSAIYASEKEWRASLHSQVAKALNCAAAADEAAVSNVLMLSGFNIPKLVLQIVPVDLLLRVSRPGDEVAIFKEFAFTVYNKARRIPRSSFNSEMVQLSSASGRLQPSLMHASSPTPGLWKDCLASRISGPNITREGDLDSTLRPGTWDNSWQTLRTGGLSGDSNRSLEFFSQDDLRYLFEPLFILSEPGSAEVGNFQSSFGSSVTELSNSRSMTDDSSSSYLQSSISGGVADIGTSPMPDGSELEQRNPSLHCCYGWTEDWRWLVCYWTDARGELLDSQVFPFGGISSRQDTKVLQCLFVQILHQGCQLLASSPDSLTSRARNIIITRIGCFFELECQEWQKAIYSVGGNEVRKWPIQLRRSVQGIASNNNGTSLQQQDMSVLQERSIPSSPSPLYSPHSKSSNYVKGSLGQANCKKPLSAGQAVDSSRGLFQLVQGISLVGVSIDHSLHLILPADPSSAGGAQTSNSSTPSGYLEGFTPVKSLGASSHSFLLVPSPSMRYLSPTPLQLPTCLKSESPPLAHLLHSKGSAIPLSTAYVVSKGAPSAKRDPTGHVTEEWPSILAVSLIDHYGGNTNNFQEKMVRGCSSTSNINSKQGRNSSLDFNGRDHDSEAQMVLESIAAELHSLSWMTVSPLYPERRTVLPFHCDMLLRTRRLLHYADTQLSQMHERNKVEH